MDALLRLLLRFILVPLGYLAAVIAGSCVILLGSWRFAEMLVSQNPDVFATGVLGFALAGPVLFVMLFSVMWLPGAVGILIAEAFAIRSWIFHALNGAICGLARLADASRRSISRASRSTRPHSCSAPASRAASPIGRSRAGTRASGSRCSRQRTLPPPRERSVQSARANRSLTANAPIRAGKLRGRSK